jgi:hypothetical protein
VQRTQEEEVVVLVQQVMAVMHQVKLEVSEQVKMAETVVLVRQRQLTVVMD